LERTLKPSVFADFSKTVIRRRLAGVVRQLITAAQLLANLPEIHVRIRRFRVKLVSAGFFGDTSHHADSVFVARG
jgi:hypothetical protein